ncbi:L-threonylcarbamoyladenylate synthase [Rhizobium oryzicola]|uniref:Threonylcarbamoyl-AMP synthase n=1 Tax=Rhizobium oryzicola TaxID=1232668 RepID=A0ABT8ST79_9HYPH|nr:L-threonylcarbamoyladenylate synthase [Rhizobium oryzicola]MDO1581238.1 L-threonylcarbamoyladenylate synthase [Rhizobium oryzicola]
MAARIIDIAEFPEDALREACARLGEGLPIALPTETVYGLAADATNPAAVTRIYETKGRPRFNPLISHMADLAMAEQHVEFDPLSLKLAEAFWPGPLTLVLPRKPESAIHDLATAGLDTVGVRVPKGSMADVIRRFGRPLAAPSANTSGQVSPTTAAHVFEDLGEKLTLILDGGSAPVGVESTIIRVEGGNVRLLRPGGISAEAIEALLGVTLLRPDGPSATIEAPGMLASHYAPGADVRLNATSVSSGEALIKFANVSVIGEAQAAGMFDLSPRGDLAEAAANLFSYLKLADATGAKAIAVTAIPSHGLGEAINDRLQRAAAPRE